MKGHGKSLWGVELRGIMFKQHLSQGTVFRVENWFIGVIFRSEVTVSLRPAVEQMHLH